VTRLHGTGNRVLARRTRVADWNESEPIAFPASLGRVTEARDDVQRGTAVRDKHFVTG